MALWIDRPEVLWHPDNLRYFVPSYQMSWKEQANALVRFIAYFGLITYLINKQLLLLTLPLAIIMIVQYYLHKNDQLEGLVNMIIHGKSKEKFNAFDPRSGSLSELEDVQPLNVFGDQLGLKSNPDKSLYAQDYMQTNMIPREIPEGPEIPEPEYKPKEITCKRSTEDNPFGNALPYDSIDKQIYKVCPDEFVKDENFSSKLFNNVDDLFGKNNNQRQFTTNPNSTKINDRNAFMQFAFNSPYTLED